MFSNIRIFTATLGGKNFLVKRQVFSNWAEKGDKKEGAKNYLHFRELVKMPLNTSINRNNYYY